jgi:ATP-dependent DNA helicase RecG
VAGQISGFDEAPVDARRARLERMRQVLMRLDSLLGLPIPRSDRGLRPKLRRQRPVVETRDEDVADAEEQVRPARPAAARPSDEQVLLDGDLDLDAVLEFSRSPDGDDDEDDHDDDASVDRDGRSGPWAGNPYAPLEALALDDPTLVALRAAGLSTVGDLLLRAPSEQEVLRPIHGAGRDLPEGRIAVGGRLSYRWTVFGPGGRRDEATLVGAGPVRLSWAPGASSAWWLSVLHAGDRVVVAGHWDGQCLRDPELAFDDDKCVRIPRYGIPGVDDGRLQALFYRILPAASGVRDPLPGSARGRHLALADALVALHARGDAERARDRLAFDEALLVSLAHGWSRLGAQKTRGIAHAVLHGKADRLLRALETRLDDDQERAFDDVRRDLRRARPMRRVLTGPPGGRKGLIAMLTAAVVAEGKAQVLWLAPDAASADHRFTYAEPMLRELGFTSRLAPDAPNAGLRDALRRGEVHVLFGTDALVALAEPLEFRRLGLVISIERDRLGGVSRAVDEMKAPRPDLLVIPAAPASAEAMLGPWSNHDVSTLPGAAPPDVVIKLAGQRDAAYAAGRHALLLGAQVAVLWPQRGGADALDPTEARRVVAWLAEEAMPGARVALLHGSMSRDERAKVMLDTAHRRHDVVFATGPMEDLPPIPGLAVAVVENAHVLEPLRLARLAGLGVEQVVLVVPEETPEVRREELRAVVRGERAVRSAAADGFALPPFRFLDPRVDGPLIVEARSLATDILSTDAGLRAAPWGDLLRATHARWRDLFGDTPCPFPEPGDGAVPKRKRRRRRRR